MGIKDKISGDGRGKIVFCVNAAVIYALIYFVAYQVPIHSDDYSYYQLGLSLKSHIEHYLGWSGRFITDYISSLLLNLLTRPVYMAVNSFVLLTVMVLVSVLPSFVRNRGEIIHRGSSVILWLVFVLYWVANPDLGQTSFWVVGSANYGLSLFSVK